MTDKRRLLAALLPFVVGAERIPEGWPDGRHLLIDKDHPDNPKNHHLAIATVGDFRRAREVSGTTIIEGNTTFLSFKESGKWYATGRGKSSRRVYIELHESAERRRALLEENGGKLPGLSGEGREFIWVVIPDEDADGFPLMLKP